MADTTFVNGTPVVPDWLNDVNDFVYGTSTIQTSIFKYMTPAQIADVKAGTLAVDVTSAFTDAIAAGETHLVCPAGKYRLSPMVWTGLRGFILEGQASAIASFGLSYQNNTTFVFDNASSGTDGITISDFVGVTIKDIKISMRRGGAGGGKALYLYNGNTYTIERVMVDSYVGSSGIGMQFGGGSGATATFIGKITNCKVLSYGGISYFANWGTSLKFDACYSIGGVYKFYGMIYTALDACACDAAGGGHYGYEIENCSGLVFDSVAAEECEKGAFWLKASTSLVFVAPLGSANNTSDTTNIGDLFFIDSSVGANDTITIESPISINSRAATTNAIYANAGNGIVVVNNVNAANLSKDIGGDSTWQATKLTRTGSGERIAWTPTLVGWTNVGTPTVTGWYVKKNSIVTFYVNITPATSISCTTAVSTITGLPFAPIGGAGMQSNGNAVSQGVAPVSASGVIYPQTSGVLTTTITIIGTLMLN